MQGKWIGVSPGNQHTVYRDILATVLIWRFGDSEANRQTKKSPILAGQLDRLSARAGSKYGKTQRTTCCGAAPTTSQTVHRTKSIDRLQTAEHAVMADYVPVLGRASLPQRTHRGHC